MRSPRGRPSTPSSIGRRKTEKTSSRPPGGRVHVGGAPRLHRFVWVNAACARTGPCPKSDAASIPAPQETFMTRLPALALSGVALLLSACGGGNDGFGFNVPAEADSGRGSVVTLPPERVQRIATSD